MGEDIEGLTNSSFDFSKSYGSGIFLGENDTEITNIGTIVKLGSSIIKGGYNFLGLKVCFKEAFGEVLIIDNEEYLFFREVEPSIYYYINEEN